MGTLYVVATPIGNLKDTTLRAIETLFSVDFLLCEDTRRTLKLLSWIKDVENDVDSGGVKRGSEVSLPRLLSFHEHNEEQRVSQVVELLQEGKDVALVSNAGTPLISDPGFRLIRECLREGIEIAPVPGVSAVTAALSVSGLPINNFLFLGFLSKKESKREGVLRGLLSCISTLIQTPTIVFFESPRRLISSLRLIESIFGGETPTVVCFELTKVHESHLRGSATSILGKLGNGENLRGEMTVLFAPR